MNGACPIAVRAHYARGEEAGSRDLEIRSGMKLKKNLIGSDMLTSQTGANSPLPLNWFAGLGFEPVTRFVVSVA